ncbi:MAG: DUF3179 domain-containing protein [Myxococcota bacterium]
MRRVPTWMALVPLLALLWPAGANASAPRLNGFQLDPSDVPVDEILRGGPPRDGIPALDHPETLPADQAPWHPEELVLGVEVSGDARAYPIAILNWHELVNDTVGGEPILISYCPLCGSGLVFDRRIDGVARSFGVSGLLYQSDLLLYDRESDSLWSQLESKAVTGPARGSRLRVLRSALVPWGTWRSRHPDTRVLSLDTGYGRDYTQSPYGGYARSDRLYFPAHLDRRYPPKAPTLGLRLADGTARAFPAPEILRAGGEIETKFANRPIRVRYDAAGGTFDVTAPPDVEVIEAYWFAWSAFHPSASVFVAVEPAAETHGEETSR